MDEGEFTFRQKRQKRDKMLLMFRVLKNNFLFPFLSSLISKIFYLPIMLIYGPFWEQSIYQTQDDADNVTK